MAVAKAVVIGRNLFPSVFLSGALILLSGCGGSGQEDTAAQADSRENISTEELLNRSALAMGAEGIGRIEFQADGWEACLGQPWNIHDGWARWTITDYDRVIDYDTFNSYQTAQRQAGMDPDKLGGCGAQPNAAVQNQQSSVNPDSSWLQQLQIHMTPMGFLRLAGEYGGEVESGTDGLTLTVANVDVDGVNYRLVGSFGDDYLPDSVLTWVDDSVFGDLPFETEFSGYRDFSGLMFPGHVVQKQGGFATLDLTVSNVIPDSDASAEPPPREARRFGGGQQSEGPPYQAIADGIYVMLGAYQSVAMEFDDFSVVIDGLQNDGRVRDIISQTKEAIPGKPIRYVISTHNHFDHASGLRQFVAEGATIITHETNVEFFEQALSTPRTLNPQETDGNGMPVNVMGVGDFFAIDDGNHRLEIYKLNGSKHADDMLIAYIPAIKTVVEADLMQPWINPVFGGGDHPFLIWFADELDRIGIDYQQFVPVHRPNPAPTMTREDLLQAVGRN